MVLRAVTVRVVLYHTNICREQGIWFVKPHPANRYIFLQLRYKCDSQVYHRMHSRSRGKRSNLWSIATGLKYCHKRENFALRGQLHLEYPFKAITFFCDVIRFWKIHDLFRFMHDKNLDFVGVFSESYCKNSC